MSCECTWGKPDKSESVCDGLDPRVPCVCVEQKKDLMVFECSGLYIMLWQAIYFMDSLMVIYLIFFKEYCDIEDGKVDTYLHCHPQYCNIFGAVEN